MNEIYFDSKKPNQVFHAAAYKHVGLVEENIIEGITNNILVQKYYKSIYRKESVEKFVLISTDKAVRPKSLMGKLKELSKCTYNNVPRKSLN